MHNILHDQIDFQEELLDKARAIVDSVRPELPAIVKRAGDTTKALEIIAALVADELSEVTTEAVRTSAAFVKRRTELR